MFIKNNIYTCIDLGSYAIKAVQIKKIANNNFKILDIKMELLPRDTIVDGVIKDESLLANKIQQIFDQFKHKTDYIITAIFSNELLIRNIELPIMDKKEVKESIKWEADEQLPYPAEDAAIDFFKVKEEENTAKYLISAVKKINIDNFLVPFKKINSKVTVVNTQPMALISVLEYQNKINQITAIIDLGYSAAQITIADKNNIYLSRTINIGGKDFTETLMEIKGEDYHTAEEIKFSEGLKIEKDNKLDQKGSLVENVELDVYLEKDKPLNKLMSNLAAEINRSFNYFNMKNKGKEISKIYLTGGTSRLKGLKAWLKADLNKEIFQINPFENQNYNLDSDQDDSGYKSEFSVALGLAMSEVMAYED